MANIKVHRAIYLVDGVIVIAAIWFAEKFASLYSTMIGDIGHKLPAQRLAVAAPWLVMTSIALLLIRLIGPRSLPLKQTWGKGDSLCLVAVLGVAIVLLTTLANYPETEWYAWLFLLNTTENLPGVVGPMMIGVWVTSAMQGKRLASDGMNRLGQTVAACWIGLFLVISMPKSWSGRVLSLFVSG